MTAVSQASAGIEVPLLCNKGPKGLVLELLQGGAAPQKLVCREFPALIGRDESANVPLSGLWVGKQHAEIRLGGGGLMVVDRGTLSGTLVNDQRISEYGPLKLGDQIQIGSWTLRVDAFESPMVVDSSDEQAKIDRAVLKLRELIDLRRKDWQGASDAVVREECRELLAPIIADLLPDASAIVRHEFMAIRALNRSVTISGPHESVAAEDIRHLWNSIPPILPTDLRVDARSEHGSPKSHKRHGAVIIRK